MERIQFDMGDEPNADAFSGTEHSEPDPVALSFAGGALGTIAGLKSGGVPGSIAGGLVGGTVGYLTGAASCEAAHSADTVTTDTDPVEVHVDETPTDTSVGEPDAGVNESHDSADTGSTPDTADSASDTDIDGATDADGSDSEANEGDEGNE